MTDSTNLAPAEPLDRSTQLDEGRQTTEGSPSKEPEEKGPESRLDAIKRAAADVDGDKPEPEVKAEPAEKQEKAEEPAKAEEKPEEQPKEAKQEERQKRPQIEAPEKFLPRAKELWHNTPHEVRSEMQRVISEAAQEAETARESVKEYEAVRPFAEIAKRGGTTLPEALDRYVNMEQTLRSDPTSGFRGLLANMQMTPQQAIGHIAAAFNVAPERLAAHMQQAPNEYTALGRPQPQSQQQPQSNHEIEALRQQIANLQQSTAHSHIETTVIQPFAQENPRYHELQPVIASFLKSDMIPKTLSPHDRLAAAYDMAVRISPSVKASPASQVNNGEEGNSESRAGEDFGGTKSVRGAPSSGMDTSSRRRGKMSRGDAISAAMSELGLAH